MPSADFDFEPSITILARGADVFEVESKTRPGHKHMIMECIGVIFCSCEGFQNHGYCWHARKVHEMKHPVVIETEDGDGT